MDSDEIAKIAEQVSILMQLDRMRHQVSTEIDMKALANVPDYIASVFENANAVGSELSPNAVYDLVNKRISQVQAQLYMMRLELENRHTRDPAQIYTDPMAISAYGERVETLTSRTKNFSFEPDILSYGWYPMEHSEGRTHRWMRPGDVSVAFVPHLGTVDQCVYVKGYVLHTEQLDDLTVCVGQTQATITPEDARATGHFTVTVDLPRDAVKSANYVPIEFMMTDFRQPNDQDTRLLGANIYEFACSPTQGSATDTPNSGSEVKSTP